MLRHGSLLNHFPGGRPLAASALGLAFALGWAACIGPVLGAIMTTSAVSGAARIVLRAAYSQGLGVPFVAMAMFADRAISRLTTMFQIGRAFRSEPAA